MSQPERPARDRRREERRLERAHRLLGPRQALLFLLGCVVFGHPFVGLFATPSRIFGIPALFVYLFVAWTAFIVILALLVEPPRALRARGRRDRDSIG